MSSDNKPKKRKFPEIPSVRATPGETTATQNTVKRMLGRLPLEREGTEVEPHPASPTNHPPTTHQPPTNQPIAPERNFSRVPNSIALSGIPSGLFRGESKKLYDALYQRTRGAVVPRRAIRATQSELMGWANISLNTLKAHIRHLSSIGLLKVHYRRGESTGADYEIFTLEDRPPTNHPPTTQPPTTNQNLGSPTHQNLVLGGGSQVTVESTLAASPKTSFKTKEENSDDDAPARTFLAKLVEAERELTGKASTSGEKWEELAEVLISELRIAAARTTVSNVPAFLAEHLRRRLWKVDKARAAEMAASQPEQEGVAPALTTEEKQKCPDCAGVGFWYPEGPEKGVARCSHLKLHSLLAGQ
ncbi:MAG TPA: hypothetical protein VGB76_10355 [Pyrinomonadaceae bacterium]